MRCMGASAAASPAAARTGCKQRPQLWHLPLAADATAIDLLPARRLWLPCCAEGDPSAYVLAFERLAAWVDGSLDLYKVCVCHG